MALNPNTPSNLTSLFDVLKTFADARESAFNAVGIGTIAIFNPVTQLAQVTLNYPKKVGNTWVSYPPLADCPVVLLGGGGGVLTFPVKIGDTCLVFFADRPISSWVATGNTLAPPKSQRMHSLADGIALVGIRNLLASVKAYDMVHAKMSMGVAEVGVSPLQVRIAAGGVTLGSVLNTMLSAMATATTAPQIAAAAAAAAPLLKVMLE